MRIFVNAWFRRFARREKIDDATLVDAISRASQGLIDADLGGGVIKQRIARRGQGKSGGYRTIIVFRQGEKAFFVYGFAKSSRDNLDEREQAVYRKAAKELLALSDAQIEQLLERQALAEVKTDGDETTVSI
ncbi:MAG: type II toxin-antitoxin system RelE/ParE family toxin [Caldilinea sp.]|nr:type II toxin-antitoxin system RelE/ParE family toxin [Caldilineaceae bacterium]MCW5840394.1 type II toxin-antitoxin system RelE/ParE family toxin [Caldilinea sp.]HRW51179.1 type II toxin-antitoxin system RelE/ParE family toxin [Caldilinea sp.]